MATNFAAIDCGTNTVRILLTKLKNGRVKELDRRLVITRLGQGVDATGKFNEEALERTFEALDSFAEEIEQVGGATTRVVATSAARDASNSQAFFEGVRERLGVDPEIIPGEEEAKLSFTGAVAALPQLDSPVLVMDIGGGSTELSLGDAKGGIEQVASLDMGSVRIRERFLASDPPTKPEIQAARAYIRELIDSSELDFSEVYTFVGVGGTVTTLSAINQGLTEYDREQVHDSIITPEELKALNARFLTTPISAINEIPTMEPGRADVITAGCLIAREISRVVGLPLRVSEADLLDGIIAGLIVK
ncbi:MAG: Ppx/GppA family phosphatase [Propionibacteriaceae bacterium]|jgi:exopolyphosphatase/guanosine-5'-triphosphate,3'-diphosphate pyrophosphatase|nr:Ppx/GppA family phosphatase [Propionibacteriaceae bacterium]